MANMAMFTALMGSTLPVVGVAGSVMYGISKFSEQKTIKEIKIIKDGEHKGKLQISVAASPFVTKAIIASAHDIRSVVALGDDNMGAADTEANLIEIDSFVDANGVSHSQDTFVLPADSFRDKQLMDWILAPSSHNDGSHDLFNDLMNENFNEKVEHGGLTMLNAYNARTTALANVATPDEVDLNIDTEDL
jgi:hypothetical protein